MTGQAPAHWHPDPFGRHELRYWDGGQWTQHVASRGRQEIDPPVEDSPVPSVNRAGKKAQRDVPNAGVAVGAQVGGGTLLTEPVLVVSRKAKLIEVNPEYAVYDQHGQQIGAVREAGQSFMRIMAMAVPAGERSHSLQVVDVNGQVLIALTRPAKILRSNKVIVRDANGAEIGQIVQKNVGFIVKIRFVFESGGQRLGSINAEVWKAWDFNIRDASGDEIARITKTGAGLAKAFTKGEHYVVQIHRSLDEPLRSLVLAAALAVDIALNPDDRLLGALHRPRKWKGLDDGDDGGGDG
jgi:uncharacterized protein YxjI